MATLEHSGTVLSNVHDPARCAGRPCTIHNRTEHSMREFPQSWRSDRGIMERICPHGVGHPDPDSPWSADSFEWLHGCDGCCVVTDVTPFEVADSSEHRHTGDMSSNTFQVGTVYEAKGGRMSFEVISRTAKFVTVSNHRGEVTRVGVTTFEGVEKAMPLGRYSMAPCISADRPL